MMEHMEHSFDAGTPNIVFPSKMIKENSLIKLFLKN